jgi:hypothetical protein
MKIGDKRALVSLELTYFPAIAIATSTLDIERKTDAGGQRVFAVTAKVNNNPETAEIVVDRDGFVVKHAIGPPMNLTFSRRP